MRSSANLKRPGRIASSLWLVLLLAACTSQPQRQTSRHARNPPDTPWQGARVSRDGAVLKLEYEGYTLWLDCERRAAVRFAYRAVKDSGRLSRHHSSRLDPAVPAECQQTSTRPYPAGYDRGHQVPANHLDHSATAIRQSNYMTNILPQTPELNRGAWQLSEMIVECYRDLGELQVTGGPLWYGKALDAPLLTTHQVRIPSAYWKLIVRDKGEAIAWVMPNDAEAVAAALDDYRVPVAQIERVIEATLPVSDVARWQVGRSWPLPPGCDRG
ncbi:MAG: DNA/RNA non-specific endonuclease [Methylococcaceae bacterium]|jgi:endonuclease G